MKKFFVGIVLTLAASLVHAASPAGNWVNIDDETGQKKAIVTIRESSTGELSARITKLLQKPGALCEKCSGERKNKPIEGMMIMWGLKPDGNNEWSNGKIFDPSNGKTYKVKLTLSPDGRKLVVRGYVGISLIGRSQTWVKQ